MSCRNEVPASAVCPRGRRLQPRPQPRRSEFETKRAVFLASPEMLQPSEYDMIFANINRNVLLKYADTFPEFLKPGGKLLISGLLLRDEPKVVQAYQNAGFSLVEKNAKKDWLMLIFELRNKTAANEVE